MGTPGNREGLPTGLQQERGGLGPVPQNEPTRTCLQKCRPGEGGLPSGVSLTVEAETVIRVLWEEWVWWTRPCPLQALPHPVSHLTVQPARRLQPRSGAPSQAAPPQHCTLLRTSEHALAWLSGYVTLSVFSSQISLCGNDSFSLHVVQLLRHV